MCYYAGMKVNRNLTKVLKKKHEEKWVALSPNHRKIIDFDPSLASLCDRLGDKQHRYTLMRVPRSDMEYCFNLNGKKITVDRV